MPTATALSTASLLATLTKARLLELARIFGVGTAPEATKEQQTASLAGSGRVHLRELLKWMARDELRRACRAHGLPETDRARAALMQRLLEARGALESLKPNADARQAAHALPRPGDIALVRQRQYLVERVELPADPSQLTRV